MTERCGCCEGIDVATPESTENRPGLPAIAYRVGTHATFFESMVASLPLVEAPAPQRPLAGLSARDVADPTLALLDAFASVADVLTFYQERIANEGYLRTATERRSVAELAALVGYAPRPGVAASAYLAFTMEDGYDGVIPKGTRAQSIPKPGETPQSFETSQDLAARALWNALKPRAGKPQALLEKLQEALQKNARLVVHLQGVGQNLKASDVFVLRDAAGTLYPFSAVAVKEVTAAPARTTVELAILRGSASGALTTPAASAAPGLTTGVSAAPAIAAAPEQPRAASVNLLGGVIANLARPIDAKSIPPRDPSALARSLESSFQPSGDAAFAVLSGLRPSLSKLISALRVIKVPPPVGEIEVFVARAAAAAFGYNAPKSVVQTVTQHNQSDNNTSTTTVSTSEGSDPSTDEDETTDGVFLDAAYPAIVPGSFAVVVSSGAVLAATVLATATRPRTAYGLSAKTTRLALSKTWWKAEPFSTLRKVAIYAQTEPLALAEEPLTDDVAGSEIPLDRIYDGLDAGRWLVLTGERLDVPGLVDGELVMLAGVRQTVRAAAPRDPKNPDGTAPGGQPAAQEAPGIYTTITFANPLARAYKRDTVTLFGNVAHATHGETREEVLGSGDASKPLQTFELRQSPLTFVSAATKAGAASTLEVRVDGVLWPEAASLAALGPRDRSILTSTDDTGKTKVIGGSGYRGARFSTGIENVTARYRSGIGVGGNVSANQVSLLMTRPLGVKGVKNPLQASGGADRETRDQVRENAPLALLALDRLVSVSDYADFARTFAGVGKAAAARSTAGGHPLIRVVVAGTSETPLEPISDVFKNLAAAFARYGAPFEAVSIEPHLPVLLFLSAKVKVDPRYEWKEVEPRVRRALVEGLGFARRPLGKNAHLSEVIAIIQGVRGVVYVDVDAFGGVGERPRPGAARVPDLRPLPPEIANPPGSAVPAPPPSAPSSTIAVPPPAPPPAEPPAPPSDDDRGQALSPDLIAKRIQKQIEIQRSAGPAARAVVDPLSEVAYFAASIPLTLILTELAQ